jgi:hypothetical protein
MPVRAYTSIEVFCAAFSQKSGRGGTNKTVPPCGSRQESDSQKCSGGTFWTNVHWQKDFRQPILPQGERGERQEKSCYI